jgi:pre-mRNA-splicing factor SYF1
LFNALYLYFILFYLFIYLKKIAPDYWKTWNDFEVQHGNEDTFTEMRRIKRSVQAQYNTDINYIAAQVLAAQKGNANTTNNGDAMQRLDKMTSGGPGERSFVK